MSTYAERLASHVLGLRPEDVPAAVRAQAVRHVTDTIGAGIHGTTTVQGRVVLDEAIGRYRGTAAQVWGHPETLDAAGASLVNAVQAHAFELDDYFAAGKTHPGTVIVPAALAAAGPSTTGEELITAIVAAYDVMCRVALALNPNSVRQRGFHITGLTGPFGAAAVASRLLGLDASQLASALGIAASCSGGIFAFTAEGAMTKPFHAGRGAEAGLVAARLAQRGFEGPRSAFEAEDGGLLGAVSDAPRPEELVLELGERFDLAGVAIKPYPCCGSIHSSIDAILELRRTHALTPDDFASITVHNAQGVLLQCGFEYTGTGGHVEAQMSLQYCLAAALVDGTVGLAQFDDSRRHEARLLDVARRVRFALDPEIDAVYPTAFAARITVESREGAELEASVPTPLGSPENALDRAGVEAKFRDITGALLPAEAGTTLLEALGEIDTPMPMDPVRKAMARASAAVANHRSSAVHSER